MMEIGRTLFLLFLCIILCITGYYSLTASFPDAADVLRLDRHTPGLLTPDSSIAFLNGSDNTAILFEGDQWKADRFLRIETDSGGTSSQASFTVRLNESIPSTARLQFQWRSTGNPDRVLVEVSEDSLWESPPGKEKAYYLTVEEPGENWRVQSFLLPHFKKTESLKDATSDSADPGIRNIRFVRLTFYPQSHSTIDISGIRFTWKSFRLPPVLLFGIVLFIGILLYLRTSREHLFRQREPDRYPNSIVARCVYLMFAVAVTIAMTGQAIISDGIWPILTFSVMSILILMDDFIVSPWVHSRLWSYRYMAMVLAAWYLNVTHDIVFLSFFLMSAMLPMMFLKSRPIILSYPVIATIGFITHPQIVLHATIAYGLIPIAVVAIVNVLIREIYEHGRAKRDIQYVRSLYEEILENTSDSIYVLDRGGNIVAANRGFELLLEYPLREIIGKNIRELVHENDLSLVDSKERDALAPGSSRNYDLRFRQKSGGVRTVLIRENVVAKDRFNTEYQVIATDITERKHAEAEREKLVEELQNVLAEVRMLTGLLPICASCKKIRDDKGYWTQLESYIQAHSDARFTHGICPECMRELYPDVAEEILSNRSDDKAE